MGQKRIVSAVSAERKQHIHLLLSPAVAKQVRDLAERERRPLSTQIEVLVERALALMQAAA